jgi:hypothetical protein
VAWGQPDQVACCFVHLDRDRLCLIGGLFIKDRIWFRVAN